jgi:hypothetical protein
VDHALREEHETAYESIGRFVLAGACVFGWGAGLIISLPVCTLALSEAFISGASSLIALLANCPAKGMDGFCHSCSVAFCTGRLWRPWDNSKYQVNMNENQTPSDDEKISRNIIGGGPQYKI